MINFVSVFISLITPFISTLSMSYEGNAIFPNLQSQAECEEYLEPFVNGNISLEQLTNPILSSNVEVDQYVDLYSTVYQCLDEGTTTKINNIEKYRAYLEYFLIFAGGLWSQSEDTTLDLVLFSTSNDPGVTKIRDEAGIEAPDGYVFVRYYISREAMPPLVRRAFESPDVAGVTILSRYIAVLADDKKTWPQRALQLQTLPETTSHELIHAYINSILLPVEFNLPAWYSEGLAIYFSGSERNHTVITPNFSISNTSSVEYQNYDTIFKYLEAKLGREHLMELIDQSIQEADPSLLYQDLGISTDQQLINQARLWSQARNNIARGGIVAVAFIGVLLLWRLAPEYNCQNCGHMGKRRDLIDEVYCPNCKRPHDRVVPY
jgi:hypothetical protein